MTLIRKDRSKCVRERRLCWRVFCCSIAFVWSHSVLCFVSFRDTILEGEQRVACRIAELNSYLLDQKKQEARNEHMRQV